MTNSAQRIPALMAVGCCLTLAGCRATGGALLRETPPVAELWSARDRAVPTAVPEKSRQVFVDVAAIARHHPAWRLADELARSGPNGAKISQPQAVRFESAPPSKRAIRPQPASAAENETDEAEPPYERPAKVLKARATDALDETARSRQEAAASEFLNAVTKRQADERAARRESLLFDLGDEIEAAQRLDIAALDPVMPDDKSLLAMTNLRLKIQRLRLERDSTRDENRQDDLTGEIRATRRQLKALDDAWAARLRVQENARQQEMKVLLIENPQKMQTAGEEKIALSLRAMTARDGAARDGVAASLRTRLSSDFSSAQPPLAVALPAAGFRATLDNETAITAPDFGLPAPRPALHRAPLLPQSAAGRRGHQPTAASEKLRDQALRESRQMVEDLARRRGWQLAARPSGQAVNRTAEALRLLKLR